MKNCRHLFGPVPSRRLGRSLGVSPLPDRTCNYACVYCQLGRTLHMTDRRGLFYPVAEIVEEFDRWRRETENADELYDVITVVGEGEPTLYTGLGELLTALKARTGKPVAVITNGALLTDPQTAGETALADIVLPSLDAADENTFRRINRPHGRLSFEDITEALIRFSQAYAGQLWLEIMLVDGFNDSDEALSRFLDLTGRIRHDRLFINTPVRPPAEEEIRPVTAERLRLFAQELGGTAIDALTTGSFHSDIADDYAAVLSLIRRHPMNQHEITGFLASRDRGEKRAALLDRLAADPAVETVRYKGYVTYRLAE